MIYIMQQALKDKQVFGCGLQVHDFTDISCLDDFQTFLNDIVADGGDDGCEDVAGGLAVSPLAFLLAPCAP